MLENPLPREYSNTPPEKIEATAHTIADRVDQFFSGVDLTKTNGEEQEIRGLTVTVQTTRDEGFHRTTYHAKSNGISIAYRTATENMGIAGSTTHRLYGQLDGKSVELSTVTTPGKQSRVLLSVDNPQHVVPGAPRDLSADFVNPARRARLGKVFKIKV